jgi:ribosomal protein S18 acetylase RimI-like enzyme
VPAAPPRIRRYDPAVDRAWLAPRLDEGFGGPLQVRRGAVGDVAALPGFVAEVDGEPVGVLTHGPVEDETELALLWAFERRRGVGRALVAALLAAVPGPIWVVTTNDNAAAIAFYERVGFVVREVRPGAVDEARARLKPSLPLVGESGVPVRDEVELLLAR